MVNVRIFSPWTEVTVTFALTDSCDASLCVGFREAMGVVLHKDSKWYQQWKDFKDNNVVFNSKQQ